MQKQMIFHKLHTSLMRIKHNLEKKHMTLEHKEDLTREVDNLIQQFQSLSDLRAGALHVPEATMQSIEAMINRIDEELNERVSHLETEMHGGQIYSYDEYDKVKHCANIKKIKDELEKIMHLVQA